MRTDLKLNYLALENTSERINSYYKALKDIEDALKNLKNFLGEQQSEAVNILKSKLEDVNIDINKKKEVLKQLEDILNSHITEIRDLIDAVIEETRMRVDTWDVECNLMQMDAAIGAFALKQSYTVSSGCSIAGNRDNETEGKKRKLERNYNRVERFRSSQMLRLAKRLIKKSKKIWMIRDKYVKPFETLDDEYRRKSREIESELLDNQKQQKRRKHEE